MAVREDMQVVWKKVEEVTPYENNPRHNDEAVPYVAASISKFGWKVPLVIDTDGVIVSGHTRYKAAKSLGLTKVPCVIADDLTEEEIKAFRLADNKVGEIAKWDEELLAGEIEGLDIDMGEFGFIELSEINVDSFFEDSEPKEEETEEKEIQCPHCGMFFKAE